MKATRTLLIAAIGVLMMTPVLLADVEIDAQLRITPRPRADLEVYVWPDRGMDGVYYPGENINVNVEVTRDAFLILYNIDSRGNMRILFPSAPWEDNFVQAGDVIRFPRSYDDYDWTIEGPAGTEYVQAIASEVPISLPEWPVYMQSVNSGGRFAPELRDFRSGSDRYHYIDVVNRNITGRYYDWCATDVATFQVRPVPRYQHTYDYDPWPDVFYGEIYIGWPFGARIYVDNIYIGVAPCWVPRHYTGRRIITCYDGPRLIRRHEVRCFSKRDYYSNNRFGGLHAFVYKKGRWDADVHFRYEKESGKRNRYRVYDRDDSRDYDDDRGRAKSSSTRRSGIDDNDFRQKQDADNSRDLKTGKASRKSAPAQVKTADRNGAANFRIMKQPSSSDADYKHSSQSEAGSVKRSGAGKSSKPAPARVETAGRDEKVKSRSPEQYSNDQARVSPQGGSGASKRSGSSANVRVADRSSVSGAKVQSAEKSGKSRSTKRSKGGN